MFPLTGFPFWYRFFEPQPKGADLRFFLFAFRGSRKPVLRIPGLDFDPQVGPVLWPPTGPPKQERTRERTGGPRGVTLKTRVVDEGQSLPWTIAVGIWLWNCFHGFHHCTSLGVDSNHSFNRGSCFRRFSGKKDPWKEWTWKVVLGPGFDDVPSITSPRLDLGPTNQPASQPTRQ